MALALNQITGWQVQDKHLILQLGGEFFQDVLNKNITYLLTWFQEMNIDIETLEVRANSPKEQPLENWDEQRQVWLDIFRGQELDSLPLLGDSDEK